MLFRSRHCAGLIACGLAEGLGEQPRAHALGSYLACHNFVDGLFGRGNKLRLLSEDADDVLPVHISRLRRRVTRGPDWRGGAQRRPATGPRLSPWGSESIRPTRETAPPPPPFVLEATIARGRWNEQARPLYLIRDRQRAGAGSARRWSPNSCKHEISHRQRIGLRTVGSGGHRGVFLRTRSTNISRS